MTNEIVKTETLPIIVELQYEVALQAPDVRAALFDCEGAQARRDSIGRKLCSGSTAVTVRDLERWEKALSDAKKVLMQIAPILERHPICASVVAHS
ncbi:MULTISPECIES: hypothetical protein [Pseudomonas syringae group]|uniref:Uncharacterized protein n=8 Tax=Pseudomonas syringae group TaxID=136849 RepID=A0A3M5B917_PSESS|nr:MULTISPECIES: hypothetical protein [Pseudomonas syringae group]EGH27451.1 hypothetical protein PSYMO_40527 [Pseudomonas amygdali pv. mori str. 301020]KWT03875.1 hypothetical protein AL047_01770 [Pseudomonas syringae pv. broussonetiae]PPS28232.1 hypothetical protein BVY12_25115 [Pseudomonas amygdali pv. morsprunorum]ARA79347.1 hypothetical protein B5U27_04260 [Pseudomonas amygdali pv. lachrymans]AXH55775.1 hypothetical protein PLA107_010965 [Pseudomonas amygdali pv. lachrymans str. M301315]